MDYAAHRRRVLKHCLWLANFDMNYARWAAKRYELDSDGVLTGLCDRIEQTIAKHLNQPQPESNDDLSD